MERYQQKILLKRTGDSAFEIGNPNEYLSRPHMCETCGKRFTLLENLNRHQMIHTDERPFACKYCCKRFRLAQHLKEHVRIHTGEKPYKCPTCGRAFCQISNLKSHQKTHTKIKAYKCDVCQKSFRRSFTLKQHKLTHTRRSYSAPNDVQERKLYRNMSAPTPTISSADGANHPNEDLSLGQMSSASFHSPLLPPRHYRGETFPLHPDSRFQTINSNSRPMQVVKEDAIQQMPVTPSQPGYPSLSALLCANTDGKLLHDSYMKSSTDMLQYYRSLHALPRIHERETLRHHFGQENSISQGHEAGATATRIASSSEVLCIHCNRQFPDSEALRDHVIIYHRRKEQRHESACSTNDHKSPSPKIRKASSAPATALPPLHDVPAVAPERSYNIESSFMQRVKELALRSLGRTSELSDVTQNPITSQCDVEVDVGGCSDECVVGPDVGHSPTGNDEPEEPPKSEISNAPSTEKDVSERKFVKRAADGSQKWKTKLCKEWYDVPGKRGQDDKRETVTQEQSEAKEDTTLSSQSPEKNIKQENLVDSRQNEAHAEASQHIAEYKTAEQIPRSGGFDYQRFAPIVEWKPVVTGWKDLVSGTLYAALAQMQPNIFGGPTTPLIDPRLLYQPPNLSELSSYSNNSDESGCSSSDVLHAPNHDISSGYFRFSPRTIQSFAIGGDVQTPITPESGASSGVYSNFYPSEALPISEYSRLQHALLYQWDPNRTRLGGTSSVPQSANIVSAT